MTQRHTIMGCTRGALLACLICLTLAVFAASETLAQGCSTRASTPAPLPVFDRPPEATTGRGFVYGQHVFTIPAKSVFYTCKEVKAGFGLVTERWVQVALWLPEKKWIYGWVRAENLTTAGLAPRTAALHVIAPAHAATYPAAPQATGDPAPAGRQDLPAQAATDPVAPQAAGDPAPAGRQNLAALKIPENEQPSPPAMSGEESALTVNSILLQAQFVLMLSVAVLLGILAQGAYEVLGTEQRLSRKDLLKLFVRPLLVSPIVLLIFLGTVDLNIAQWKQALILALLAFQAGFSWQKALERKAGEKPQAEVKA